MEKVAFLGSANALKPLIIMTNIFEMNLLKDKELFLITDNNKGILYDYCIGKNIEIIVIKSSLNDQESEGLLKESNIDLLISCGWPNKIPKRILKSFKYQPINCHGSVLPDYRGSRSYMHYWANCEEYYGASIHYMNEKIDDGNVIIQGKLKMFLNESPEILHTRTAELCAYLLPPAIDLVKKGYLGSQSKGCKRYFYKLNHKEFEKYREFNKTVTKNERILTPHKIL